MSEEMKIPRIAYKVVGLIERRPWLAILAAVLVVGATVPGLKHLKADFTHRAFFFDDDPLLVQFDAFERRFGNDDAVVVAINSPNGVFDNDTATLLNDFTEKMWQVPEVIRVDSLANYNWVHADGDDIIVERFFPNDRELTPELLEARKKTALAHEVLPNYLVSKDATTAMVMARIRPGIETQPDTQEITLAVRKLIDASKRTDHEFYVSGGPPLSFAFKESAELDLSRMIPALFVVIIIILALHLRSVVGVILPFVVATFAIVASMGFAGVFGIVLGNITTQLPNMLIAVSIADAVHVLVTYFRARQHGADRKEAARKALLKNFVPTLLTSFTTAMGFFSFMTATLKPLYGVGVMAGYGTIVAWITTYLVIGALLFLLPLKVPALPPEKAAMGEQRAARYVDWILKRRVLVVVAMSAVCITAGVLALKNEVNSDPFKYFKEGFPARTANEFIEKKVGGARGAEIVVEAGAEDGIKEPAFLRKVEELQKWIETQPMVTRAVSIVDVLKATHRSLNGDDQSFYALADSREAVSQELFLYTMSLPQGMDLNDRVSLKNDALRMTVLWTIPTSRETVDFIEVIEKKAKDMGLNASVTGKNRLWQSMNGYVVNSFINSFLSAALTISLIIIIALRSIGFGLLAMVPNVVPLVFTGAFLYLLGQPLDVGSVVIASVVLGIAVDDTIHVLANFKRARLEGKSPRDALVEVFAHTTPAIVSTTSILVAGFGVFAFATFMPNVYFGVLTGLTLFVAALIDFTLTPVLLVWRDKGDAKAAPTSKAAA
jgi:uncharacterized protein